MCKTFRPKLASDTLQDSTVRVTTVIGFPHGTTTTQIKLEEAKEAIEVGAVELDVVLNIGKLKSGDYEYVKNDLAAVIDYAHSKEVMIKVIFENCFLDEQDIIEACSICNEVTPDWIKTSTSFATGGAEDKDIKLMRKQCKEEVPLALKEIKYLLRIKKTIFFLLTIGMKTRWGLIEIKTFEILYSSIHSTMDNCYDPYLQEKKKYQS